MSLYSVEDFSAGVYYKKPHAQIPKNGLYDASNMYWKDGSLTIVPGSRYGGTATNLTTILNVYWYDTSIGVCFADLSGSSAQFYTIEPPGDRFTSQTFTLTAIDATFTANASAGEFVRFSGDLIVFNHGALGIYILDKSSGSWTIMTLDEYDTRQRTDVQWFAGNYDETGPTYTDDTTDAQDAGANDFDPCPSAVNGDGFYVSGVVRFNKVILKNLTTGLVDAASVVYAYYDTDGNWTSVGTLVTTPTWSGAGDKTIEFNIPDDWATWDGVDAAGGLDGNMAGRYVFRVIFGSITSTDQADTVEVYHTQRITEITGGAAIEEMGVHDNRLYLSYGSTINYSPYAQLTEWTDYEKEYVREGGNKVNALKSFKGFLCVFKDTAIHGIYGSSYEDMRVEKIEDVGSLSNGRLISIVDEGRMFFLDTAGDVRMFDGENSVVISSPIDKWKIDAMFQTPLTTSHGLRYMFDRVWCNWRGGYLFDPYNIRQIERGTERDTVAAFWPLQSHAAATALVFNRIFENYDTYDSNILYFSVLDDIFYMDRQSVTKGDATNGEVAGGQVTATFKAIDCEKPQTIKTFRRLKIDTRFTPELVVTLQTDDDETNKQTVINQASYFYVVGDIADDGNSITGVSATDLAKCADGDTYAGVKSGGAAVLSYFWTGTPIAEVLTNVSLATSNLGYKAVDEAATDYTFWFCKRYAKYENSIPYIQDGLRLRVTIAYSGVSSSKSWGMPNSDRIIHAPFEILGLYVDYKLRRF